MCAVEMSLSMSSLLSSPLLLSLVSSLSLSVSTTPASGSDGFYYYQSGPYEYEPEISKESGIVNASLLEDIQDTFSKLSQEQKVMTFLDLRDLSNNFFIKHSLSLSFDGSITNFVIPVEGAAPVEQDECPISARLYKPSQDSRRLVFFMHGGGWVQGNLDTHDYLCKRIATTLECEVLSVDYRLAPENIFPKGLEDVTRAYRWLTSASQSKGSDIGINSADFDEIYLCGDSVGGTLAITLTLNLKRKGWKGRMPDGFLLLYPSLSGCVEGGSFESFKDQVALSAAGVLNFFNQYLGANMLQEAFQNNELIFPLNAAAQNYPKTFMVAAGCDVLLDGQIALYEKLEEAGIPVKLLIKQGAVHGFMTYGKEFDRDVCNALERIKGWIESKS